MYSQLEICSSLVHHALWTFCRQFKITHQWYCQFSSKCIAHMLSETLTYVHEYMYELYIKVVHDFYSTRVSSSYTVHLNLSWCIPNANKNWSNKDIFNINICHTILGTPPGVTVSTRSTRLLDPIACIDVK